MKKTLLEIYALLICLICLGVVAFNIVDILQATVRVVNPTLELQDYEYDRYQSNDAYWAYKMSDLCSDHETPQTNECTTLKRPPEDQLVKERSDDYRRVLSGVVHKSTKGIVDSSIRSLIFFLIFFVHWKMALRARKESAA